MARFTQEMLHTTYYRRCSNLLALPRYHDTDMAKLPVYTSRNREASDDNIWLTDHSEKH